MSKTFTNETEFLWADEEEQNYTTVDNYICNNNNIEFNTQGIYLQIVKFKNSPTHKVYMSGLESTGKGSKRDIQRGILNLRMEGFLIREVVREKGKFKGYIYRIRRKPVELTTAEKIAIYTETKINKEYTIKVYGKEFAKMLDNEILKLTLVEEKVEEVKQLHQPKSSPITCDTLISTESTNCDIGNCDIRNCATKKENGLKKKITKKENKSSSSVPSEIEEDEDLTDIINLFKECINRKITSKQKDILKELVATYGKEKVLAAIEVTGESASSPNLKYVRKCCVNGINGINSRVTHPKNNSFTSMYTHDWDLDELERAAVKRMADTLYQD